MSHESTKIHQNNNSKRNATELSYGRLSAYGVHKISCSRLQKNIISQSTAVVSVALCEVLSDDIL